MTEDDIRRKIESIGHLKDHWTEILSEWVIVGALWAMPFIEKIAWEWIEQACSKRPITKDELPILRQSFHDYLNKEEEL